MKKVLLLVLMLTIKLSFLIGTIRETSSFNEIIQYANENTLIILDIDDTLLIPKQTLGCDAWFMYRITQHELNGLSKKNAFEKALAEWQSIRHLTEVELVEAKTDEIISQLQEKHITIMALTTQGLALAARTIHQLHSLNIDLNKTAPFKEEYYFINGPQGVLYRQGILFTSGTKKGKALLNLLEHIKYRPEKIVFINDKRSHLQDLEEDLEHQGFNFTGLRYNIGDDRVKNFNKDVANIQWQFSTFEHILSDNEAIHILNAQ